MGLSMFADRSRRRRPYPVLLVVLCDGAHAEAPTETFDATEGHPRDAARKAGWKFTVDGLTLCPACARGARGR